jgi:hypothetical protein
VYDRFLLGPVLIGVLFAALGLDLLVRRAHSPTRRAMIAGACILLAGASTLGLNWRIVSDSRRDVERWMKANLRDDPFVLGAGLPVYLPNLHPFRHVVEDGPDSAELLEWEADAIVVNEQWVGRSWRETPAELRRAFEQAGYVEAFAVRDRVPGWIAVVVAFDTLVDPTYSNLAKIDPPLSVWIRRPSDDAGP